MFLSSKHCCFLFSLLQLSNFQIVYERCNLEKLFKKNVLELNGKSGCIVSASDLFHYVNK